MWQLVAWCAGMDAGRGLEIWSSVVLRAGVSSVLRWHANMATGWLRSAVGVLQFRGG